MFYHIQRILLLTAWGLLFAHSVVPHAHEVENELAICASEHSHSEDLWDALGHIFHFSTGVEHLEEFNQGNATIVFFAPEGFRVALPILVFSVASFGSPKTYLSKTRHRFRPLRAPPVYS